MTEQEIKALVAMVTFMGVIIPVIALMWHAMDVFGGCH